MSIHPAKSTSGPCRRAATGVLMSAILSLLYVTTTPPTLAQQHSIFTSLHSFTSGTDGAAPEGTLVRDEVGNLYGTTNAGGAYGWGEVFKLGVRGRLTVLYSFTLGADGAEPDEGVVRDTSGNLYGTTSFGGRNGNGTVFKLEPSGRETVLHSFKGRPDGKFPTGILILDSQGNLYGVTLVGGTYDAGTAFTVDPDGKETVLYSFDGGADGKPFGGLVMDSEGNLYGTTVTGGTFGGGTVFTLDLDGHKTVLHNFGGPDGEQPNGSLMWDAAGNLYGCTFYGGAFGQGTVFKLEPDGVETVLYSFGGGADGGHPAAGLTGDPAGNLYGTTSEGGAHSWGTVFAVDPTGKETVLYAFRGGRDGGSPYRGLARDAAGALYGVTVTRGLYDSGTVFRVTP